MKEKKKCNDLTPPAANTATLNVCPTCVSQFAVFFIFAPLHNVCCVALVSFLLADTFLTSIPATHRTAVWGQLRLVGHKTERLEGREPTNDSSKRYKSQSFFIFVIRFIDKIPR